MSGPPVLELRQLAAGYGGSAILQDINLSVGESEIVAVLGRNGMGKTTLLKSIMGLLPCTGQISFLGAEIGGLPSHLRAQRGIGYVPQGRGLFSNMTVADNLKTGMMIGSTNRTGKEGLRDLLDELFPILKARQHQMAGTMSGGEQQQVAIARAMIGKPALLVLDEPSEGIQPSIVRRITEIIRRLNQQRGQAVLIVEQNIEVIAALAQRCYVVENGRVTYEVAVEKGNSAMLFDLLKL